MAQLPKERPALAPWKKNALLVIFTLIGCGLAASIIPQGDAGGAEIIRNFAILLTDLKNFAVAGVAVLMLSVSVIWSIERGF